MREIALILVVTILFISPAGADKAAYIYGAGMLSCGQWSQLRKNNDPNEYQLQAWIDGFLSGYNLASDETPDFLANEHDGSAIYGWLDNYCSANPLDNLVKAALFLRKELIRRAKQ